MSLLLSTPRLHSCLSLGKCLAAPDQILSLPPPLPHVARSFGLVLHLLFTSHFLIPPPLSHLPPPHLSLIFNS